MENYCAVAYLEGQHFLQNNEILLGFLEVAFSLFDSRVENGRRLAIASLVFATWTHGIGSTTSHVLERGPRPSPEGGT